MTYSKSKAPLYPKSHLLAASGVAALLSLALLVFPSREVEAKKTFLDLRLDTAAELSTASEEPLVRDVSEIPFTSIENADQAESQASLPAPKHEENVAEAKPLLKEVIVANGDTLSTVFAKVGLPQSTVHDVLTSSKEAKQLARIKVGQRLKFELDEQGNLAQLRSPLNKLESVHLERSGTGYVFKKEQLKPDISTAYAYGQIESSLFLAAKRAGLSHNLTMDLANVRL